MINLIKGLLFGLAYVAPIGMQNLYVINTALKQPRHKAFITTIIVIFFDISLSLACFLGVGQLLKAIPLIKQLMAHRWRVSRYMGFSLLTDKGSDDQTMTEPETFSYRKAVTAAFTIAWLNPQAILDGTLLLGAFRASLPGTAGDIFLVGVMASSFIWFNSLTTIFSLLKAKINLRILVLINRVCGVIMMGYGVRLLWAFVASLLH
ncbi:LysE/ArgO family amino acid transporter [Secundilactobacillus collinoides]|uniref:LysE/ArgO family amino acid transporter n=1 Tax=Secundilactobacillus collinoides TaxID=33960 RepID=UPI0006D200E0|nr:LysE family transporter [Secundilactobacillus collinoides]